MASCSAFCSNDLPNDSPGHASLTEIRQIRYGILNFFFEGTPRYIRGAIRLARGETEGALADAERGLEVARAAGASVYCPLLAFFAEALLARGQEQQARTAAEEALALARDNAVVFAAFWVLSMAISVIATLAGVVMILVQHATGTF